MTVAMEGFSIREYVSRMRSIDLVKCCPFDEASEEITRAILPPITIKKFSWWFDKLQLVQDDEQNTDMDSETLQSMRMKRVKTKSRAKAPKKRSIVELFAVAPPVERVISSDDDEEDNNDGSGRVSTPKFSSCRKMSMNCKSKMNFKKKGLLMSMMKKEKVVMIKDLKKEKVKKKKQKGKKITVDLSCLKKEKASKVKLQTSASVVTNSDSPTSSKNLFDAFSTHSKKPRLKRFSGERSTCKISSDSEFRQCDQQAEFTVRGILRNPNKTAVAENISDTGLQDARKLNHYDTQHGNRCVTFSTKEDVLESRSNLFSNVIIGSSAKGQTVEVGKKLSINEESEGYRIRCAKDKFVGEQVTEKQVSGMHHVSEASNFVLGQHDISRANLFSAAVPYGQVPPHSDSYSKVTLHDELYTCSSGIPKIASAPYIPKLMIPVFNQSSSSYSCSQRWLDLSEYSYHKDDSDSSMDFLKAYSRPPALYQSVSRSNLCSKPLFCSQEMGKNHCDRALSCQWIPHLSPEELMRTISSIPDWTSRASLYGETNTSEDFVGLLLNSLGEVISLDSGVKDGINCIHRMGTIAGPSISSVVNDNTLHNPMIEQIDLKSWNEMTLCRSSHIIGGIKDSSCMVENFVLPCRTGVIEHYGIGKRSNVMQGFDPCFSSVESVLDRMNVFHIECNHDRVEQQSGGNILQKHGNPDFLSPRVPRSTMRLMGKEFTIDGINLETSEKKEVWTDKQVITENCGGNDNNTRFVVHPILGTLIEAVTDFPKYKTNEASKSDPQTMVSENIHLQFSDSHKKLRNQNDGTVSTEILASEENLHFSLASSASPNGYASTLQEFCSSHIPPPKSSPFYIHESILIDSSKNVWTIGTIPEYKKTPPHGTQFASKFPFPDLECGKHIHPASSRYSFNESPNFSGSRHKGTLMDYHHPCSTPNNMRYPCSVPVTNYGTDASIFSRPETFPLSTHSFYENAFTSASLAHCPSFPAHPGFSKESRNAPGIDNRLNSRFRVRVPTHGEGSKKKLPPASKGSKKLGKIAKMKGRDNGGNALVEGEAADKNGGIQCKQVVGSSSVMQDAGLMVHKDQPGECAGNEYPKLPGATRSGPIKLTAGAKYILMSCQNNDQANGEISSTTSVGASTYDRHNGSIK